MRDRNHAESMMIVEDCAARMMAEDDIARIEDELDFENESELSQRQTRDQLSSNHPELRDCKHPD